jgi:hypothetical protein
MLFLYLKLDLQVEAMAVHETSPDSIVDDGNKYTIHEELPCLLFKQ